MAPHAGAKGGGSRAARREKWLCKSCLGRDHKPYVNFADKLCCNSCGLAKSVVFGGPVKPSVPSRPAPWATGGKAAGSLSVQLLEMQKQVQSLTTQLKQAKAKPPESTALTASAEAGEGDAGAESSAVKKRLDELDGFVKQLAGVDTPEVAKLVEQYKSEQVKLRAQLFQEKPPSLRLKSLGFKITKVEQQITKQQAGRELKQAQLVALQAELATQDDALAESRKQLLELEGQRAQLYGAMPQPPEAAPGAGAGGDESSWTLPKLEQVLLGAGAPPDLQKDVVTLVDRMRQHRQAQEQQARAEREAAQAQQKQHDDEAAGKADAAMDADEGEAQEEESVDQATAEELRDFLRESGADIPNAAEASEEELRAAVKRIRLAKPKWKVVKKPRTA